MSKYAALRDKKPSKERMYELIRRPIITEKATLLSEFNQVTFQVPVDSHKFEIKSAVEDLFKVKVSVITSSYIFFCIKNIINTFDSKRSVVIFFQSN